MLRDSIAMRTAYGYFFQIPTRWKDNDVYGHLNNVESYSFFDTVINRYLIAEGGLDIHRGQVIGLCVESHCKFLRPMSFPSVIDAGLRVAHLGRTSVRYEIGLFPRARPRRPRRAGSCTSSWIATTRRLASCRRPCARRSSDCRSEKEAR